MAAQITEKESNDGLETMKTFVETLLLLPDFSLDIKLHYGQNLTFHIFSYVSTRHFAY